MFTWLHWVIFKLYVCKYSTLGDTNRWLTSWASFPANGYDGMQYTMSPFSRPFAQHRLLRTSVLIWSNQGNLMRYERVHFVIVFSLHSSRKNPFTVLVPLCPINAAKGWLYWDDGESIGEYPQSMKIQLYIRWCRRFLLIFLYLNVLLNYTYRKS